MHIDPLVVLASLAVGFLVGTTGMGGGALMTPILVLLFGFHPATAVGTDLLYASVTKTVGTAVHGSRKTVDWHIARGRRKLERAAMLHDRMQREADLTVEGVGLEARPATDNQRRKT